MALWKNMKKWLAGEDGPEGKPPGPDLRAGVFAIDGVVFRHDISLEEFDRLFGERLAKRAFPTRDLVYYLCEKPVSFCGRNAVVGIDFRGESIESMQIHLYVDGIDPHEARRSSAVSKQLRQSNDNWLAQLLGSPDEVAPVSTKYRMPWGRISSQTDPREMTAEIIVSMGDRP